MGRNSKARREARRRTRPEPGTGPLGSEDQGIDRVALADLHLTRQIRRLGPTAKPSEALGRAASARHSCHPLPAIYLGRALADITDRVLAPVLAGGWSPVALAEAVERHIGEGHGPVLAQQVRRVRRLRTFPVAAWDAELEALGQPRRLDPELDEDLALGMRVVALLTALPTAVDVPFAEANQHTGPTPAVGSRAEAKLAQVRALLAKAEATTFPEEAETLSAKAQELISRYSLELLVEQLGRDQTGRRTEVSYRRLWLDAPYVSAKANLVHQVALANRVRCVLHSRIGLCTLIGSPFDLDAVELMVTSLLAQAQRAMLAHGSARDSYGATRTRSFRQSFLVSFAVHIGERLRATSAESVATASDAALLPAIVAREAEVDHLTERLFPNLVQKATRVSNAAGWAGGRAAAELALLDAHERLPDDPTHRRGASERPGLGA